MPLSRAAAYTALAMAAFAGNSLLCRLALHERGIDAASFTAIRLLSGAATLWLICAIRGRKIAPHGSWLSALALLAYAVAFSFAYVSLAAATGALLLFGAVQVTMIGAGIARGERLRGRQIVGVLLAIAGLVILLLPGLAAPPLTGTLLMVTAGVAWGAYSLRGRGAGDPTLVTAGNFLRTVPAALVLAALGLGHGTPDRIGVEYAVASGALASGLGYAIWYAALPSLKSSSAAVVQLCVPVLAALGGYAFLSEPVTLRLMLASAAVLGGIALVIARGPAGSAPAR